MTLLKSTAALVSASFVSQLIALALSPIITRIYSPEDLGLYGLYLSVLGILITVACLRYDLAIVLPKTSHGARSATLAAISVSALFSAILLSVVLPQNKQFAQYLGDSKIAYWLLFLPLVVFFWGVYLSFNYWLIRNKEFIRVAKNRVGRRLVDSSTLLYLGWIGYGAGLIVADIVGRISVALFTAKQSINAGFNKTDSSGESVKEVIFKYRQFPLYNSLPAVANAAGINLPLILISMSFSQAITGQFNLTRQVLALPFSLLAINISHVLLERIAERVRSEKTVAETLRKMAILLCFPGIASCLLIAFWGPEIFTLVFGDRWLPAGVIAQVLAPAFALKFVVSPLSCVFQAMGNIKPLSIWQLTYFLAISSLYFFVNADSGVLRFITLYAIIDVVLYTVYFLLIFREALSSDKNVGKSSS